MYDAVGTLDDQVYLTALLIFIRNFSPWRNFRCHTGNPQSFLDTICVHQTDNLKSKPLPRGYQTRLEVVTPPLLITRCVLCDKLIIEQGIEIHQAINGIFCLTTKVLAAWFFTQISSKNIDLGKKSPFLSCESDGDMKKLTIFIGVQESHLRYTVTALQWNFCPSYMRKITFIFIYI